MTDRSTAPRLRNPWRALLRQGRNILTENAKPLSDTALLSGQPITRPPPAHPLKKNHFAVHDFAPLVCAAAETKNSLTIRLQIVPSKKERLSLHLRLFSSLEGVVRVNLDVFEHEITSDTIGKAGKNPRTRYW